jgi:Arc/MetJ-type ribon-helix-helix transcriptional regulator
MHILVDGDMLRQLKRVAASNRFRSMSEMVRNTMKQYLDQEVRRG